MAEVDAPDPYDNTILLVEKEDAIADLCTAAGTNVNVRDCIRKYDPSAEMNIIENEMKSCTKALAVETLEFLGCPGMNDYYKDHCDSKLICRIQNFMPDICGLCKEKFCIKIDGQKTLLECVMCGQGCHNPCVLNALGKTTDDIEGLSKEQIDKMLNPYANLGLIYMCHACQIMELPSSTEGLTEDGARKRHVPHTKSKERNSRKSLEAPNPPRNVNFTDDALPGTAKNPVIVEDALAGSAEYPIIIRDDTHTAPSRSKQIPTPVCRYYKRGTCKHGANGRINGICAYAHPKYCRSFVMYGNRSPRGCSKGESCNAFHPKICYNSLKDGACYNTSCKHRHLKNTRKELPIDVSDTNIIHTNRNSNKTAHPDLRAISTAPTPGFKQTMFKENATSAQSDYFLDALIQFKEQMIATIDLKLKEMVKADQYPPLPVYAPMQAYQAQYHPNPHPAQFNMQQIPPPPQTRLVQQHLHQTHPTQYQ